METADVIALSFGVPSLLIAGAGALIALFARRDSKVSARAAVDSAADAKRATDIAEQAEARAELEYRRSIERHDVEWKGELAADRERWLVTNFGSDTALHVRAVLTIEGERVMQQADRVAGRGQARIEWDIAPWMMQANKGCVELYESMKEAGMQLLTDRPSITIAWRVEWETPLGNPRSYEVSEQSIGF